MQRYFWTFACAGRVTLKVVMTWEKLTPSEELLLFSPEVWSRVSSISSLQPGTHHQLPQPTSPTEHSHCWGPEEPCAQSLTHRQRAKLAAKAVQSILFWKAFNFKKSQKSKSLALFYYSASYKHWHTLHVGVRSALLPSWIKRLI